MLNQAGHKDKWKEKAVFLGREEKKKNYTSQALSRTCGVNRETTHQALSGEAEVAGRAKKREKRTTDGANAGLTVSYPSRQHFLSFEAACGKPYLGNVSSLFAPHHPHSPLPTKTFLQGQKRPHRSRAPQPIHQNLVMVVVSSGLEMNSFRVCSEAKLCVLTFSSPSW